MQVSNHRRFKSSRKFCKSNARRPNLLQGNTIQAYMTFLRFARNYLLSNGLRKM